MYISERLIWQDIGILPFNEKLMLIAEENQEVLSEKYTKSWPLELEKIDSDSKSLIVLMS